LRRRGVTARIARPGVESKQRLGRHRWVVERTNAWKNQQRRLPSVNYIFPLATITLPHRVDVLTAFISSLP
jgi:hypothetical protein